MLPRNKMIGVLFIARVIVALNEPILPTTMDRPCAMEHRSNLNQDCIEKCTLTAQRIDCIDYIPSFVNPSIKYVVLSQFSASRFLPGMFCDVIWPNVTDLTISNYDGNDYISISNYTFDGLHKIQSLKLNLPLLYNFSLNAFYGLPDVKFLDLTDCVRLEISELILGLTVETNIPKFQTLILRNVGSALEGLNLSEEFIDTIAARKISTFDLCYTTVKFRQSVMAYQLCSSLENLNLSYARLQISDSIESETVCNSLRILDVSAAQFPGVVMRIQNGNVTIRQPLFTFDKAADFFHWSKFVSVLYANSLLSPGLHVSILNLTFHFPYPNSLTEIHLSGYSLPVFEVIIKFDYNVLRYLDLSHNGIQQLSPLVFSYLGELETIDVSNNRLCDSKQFNALFNNLFRYNAKLQTVSLAYNGLTYLPSIVFESNTLLTNSDLSGNKFTQISFLVSHLSKLRKFDLSNNLVEYFNAWSREQIDSLNRNKKRRTNMSFQKTDIDFAVDLEKNPLSCKCFALKFIEWLNQSPVFKDARDRLHCNGDRKRVPMNENAVQEARYVCDEPNRKLKQMLLNVLLPCTLFGGLLFILVALYKRNKRRKRFREVLNQINDIRENNFGFRFPVFLSYASVDSDFVELNIYRPLQDKLRVLTGSDRDMVAIGDRYFRIGRSIFAEIIRLLEDCAVFVVVLSKNYCNSEYCKHEIEQARLMRKPIVLIMKEYVEENEMNGVIKDAFKHFTRIKVELEGEKLKLQQDWEYISESIILLV